MKYTIHYEVLDGCGHVNMNGTETEVRSMVETLANSGCRNIAVERIHEDDPCDHCNKPICHGCPHAE